MFISEASREDFARDFASDYAGGAASDGGDEFGGVVERHEEVTVGVVGGLEVGDEEAGGFDVEGWVGHCVGRCGGVSEVVAIDEERRYWTNIVSANCFLVGREKCWRS